MTVAELLTRIMAAYLGATSEALETYTPVFYARLRRHEGPDLEEAATAVLGTFKPTFRQPFPIPVEFEAHLPSNHPKIPDATPSIKADLEERARRREANICYWLEGQGARIKAERPLPVYIACLLSVLGNAQRSSWRNLTAEQIDICEQRALCQARVRMFGALPPTNAMWDDQIAHVRAAMSNHQSEINGAKPGAS